MVIPYNNISAYNHVGSAVVVAYRLIRFTSHHRPDHQTELLAEMITQFDAEEARYALSKLHRRTDHST